MTSFFPTPYPDELLYSVLARYHVRSGNLSPKATLRELFGSTTITATVDLPSHLNALVQNLPPLSKHTVESLIQNHTLYPFYAPFLFPDKAELVNSSMIEHSWGDIHTRAGIMASSVRTPSRLRFCPACFREDQEKYGEAYWHRLHQLPGVVVCHVHLTLLQDSNVAVRAANKHEFIAASEDNCLPKLRQLNYQSDTFKQLVGLAQDVEWLLSNVITPEDTALLVGRYKSLLIDGSLATTTGRVRQGELIHRFSSFFGSELLELLDSDVSYESESNWLSNIVRKHWKTFHPLRHLLLMRFLGHPVTSFFALEPHFKPFGGGPWRCFNGAAEHYLQLVVTQVEVTWSHDSKKALGTFPCSCGFRYSTTDPLLPTATKFRFGKVKAFGVLWEQKLRWLVEVQKFGLREAARQLGVDPLTIKRNARRLGVSCQWSSRLPPIIEPSTMPSHKAHGEVRAIHRKTWMQLFLNDRGVSKTAMRLQVPATYTWLYRHDRIWLDSHSPSRKAHAVRTRRVDWDKRDMTVLAEAQTAVRELLKLKPPVRVTVSRVGKDIGLLALLEQHSDKLLFTKAYLETVTESQEQFQVRRVKWATTVLDAQGKVVKGWEIVRLAGLGKTYSNKVGEAVAEAIDKANNSRSNKMAG
jgi:hypothetical protein